MSAPPAAPRRRRRARLTGARLGTRLRIGQRWRHRDTGAEGAIRQIYRADRKVLFLLSDGSVEQLAFVELANEWEQRS